MSPYPARFKGSKIPSVGYGDQASINSLILYIMLNRLNNLKFVWGVMMIFLMTCLPGCKSIITSVENTGIEIGETLTKPITVLTPKSLRGDFASPNSSILRFIDSFPQLFRYASLRESGRVEVVLKVFLTTKNTKNSQSPLIIKTNNQIFVSFAEILCDLCGKEFRLLKQALPTIVNSRSRKDEFKSHRHCGIFFAGRTKTARLFRPNSPTI